MSAKKISIISNYLYNVSYTLFNLLLPIITARYIANVIGVEGIGIYSKHYVVAHYFYIASKLGLGMYGTRSIAMVRNDKSKLDRTFSEIYHQQVLVASSAIVLYIIYSVIRRNSDDIYVILPMGFFVITGLIEIDWLYAGLEQFKSISRKNIFVKILATVLIFTVVKRPEDLWLYTAILSLSTFIGAASMWWGRKNRAMLFHVPVRSALQHINTNLTFVFPVIATSIYRMFDKLLLGVLGSDAMLGYYELAEKIIFATCGLITAYGTVVMPRVSNYVSEGNEKQGNDMAKLSLFLLMIFMSGVSFGLAAISNPLSTTLYGSEFGESGSLLFYLSFTLLFITWANVIRQTYIIPRHLEKIFIISVSVGAVINLILDVVLIPFFGSMGAVVGTIVAELSVPVVQYVCLRKEINYASLIVSTIPAILSGGFMFAVVRSLSSLRLTSSNILNLSAFIVIGVFVYGIAVTCFEMIFNKNEFTRVLAMAIPSVKYRILKSK